MIICVEIIQSKSFNALTISSFLIEEINKLFTATAVAKTPSEDIITVLYPLRNIISTEFPIENSIFLVSMFDKKNPQIIPIKVCI